jgi:hypothetical protein
MKYLKRFNESKVLDQSIIDDCKDIILELKDNGFWVNISYHFKSDIKSDDGSKSFSVLNKQVVNTNADKYNKNWITFFFSKKEDFDYSDIEDVVERLKSYLSECGLKGKQVESKQAKIKKIVIKNEFEIHFS